VFRLMRLAGLQGVHHCKRRRGAGSRMPGVFEHRVQRRFTGWHCRHNPAENDGSEH